MDAETCTWVIILFTEDPAHDCHRYLVKAADIIVVISMAADHLLQTSYLIFQNPKLMTSKRITLNVGIRCVTRGERRRSPLPFFGN